MAALGSASNKRDNVATALQHLLSRMPKGARNQAVWMGRAGGRGADRRNRTYTNSPCSPRPTSNTKARMEAKE